MPKSQQSYRFRGIRGAADEAELSLVLKKNFPSDNVFVRIRKKKTIKERRVFPFGMLTVDVWASANLAQ
jgi:hypothetical protein